VAESVDARDLKSLDRKVVPVQVRPRAPVINHMGLLIPLLSAMLFAAPAYADCASIPDKQTKVKIDKITSPVFDANGNELRGCLIHSKGKVLGYSKDDSLCSIVSSQNFNVRLSYGCCDTGPDSGDIECIVRSKPFLGIGSAHGNGTTVNLSTGKLETIEINGAKGIIAPKELSLKILKQCSRSAPDISKVSEFWTPNREQIETLEKLLLDLNTKKDLTQYRRIYAGIIYKGRKVIYVDFAHIDPNNPDWTKYLHGICDGGHHYFGVEFDVTPKTFSNWKFNGIGR
jgi:hypothetical protein